MITQNYLNFCEDMWSKWCKGNLNSEHFPRFQLEYAPEPYLRFGEGSKPLYVLLTNPGAGMDHQLHNKIQADESCISPKMSYCDASLELASFYCKSLNGSARARIGALEHLKELVGADCIVQFESLPFHSKSLPGKQTIPELVKKTRLLKEYSFVLTEALAQVSVVALSAVGSLRSITADELGRSRWLAWQAELLGLNSTGLEVCPLAQKGGKVTSEGGKVTSVFLYKKVADCTRGFVLTMGGNTFPAKAKLEDIARIVKSSRSGCV